MKKDATEEQILFMAALGKRIKQHRENHELTLEELAKKCGHDTKHGRSWLSKIENGVNDISASELKLLSKALGITCLELMHEAEEQKFCDLFKQCQDNQAFRLVQYFLKLNDDGKKALMKYAEFCLTSDEYQKKESSKDVAM